METHCTEHTDLKMNFKRLSNEANAKQLTLDKPPWQRPFGREDGDFPGQRSWAKGERAAREGLGGLARTSLWGSLRPISTQEPQCPALCYLH